jgi:hypothetical protein
VSGWDGYDLEQAQSSVGDVDAGALAADNAYEAERRMVGDNPAQGPDHDCTSPFHRDPDTDECRVCRDRALAESVARHPAGRGPFYCSVCRCRVRVAPDGTETQRVGHPRRSVPHRHQRPYRLEIPDLTPDKHDWYPGRTR